MTDIVFKSGKAVKVEINVMKMLSMSVWIQNDVTTH